MNPGASAALLGRIAALAIAIVGLLVAVGAVAAGRRRTA